MSARDGSITKSDVKARLVRYVFSDFFDELFMKFSTNMC